MLLLLLLLARQLTPERVYLSGEPGDMLLLMFLTLLHHLHFFIELLNLRLKICHIRQDTTITFGEKVVVVIVTKDRMMI